MKATVLGDVPGAAGLRRSLEDLLPRLGRAVGRDASALSILLTDDESMRDFNRRFRRVDATTDVLAFPAEAGDDEESGHYLGDLVISVERAAEQARELGHALEAEVEVLALHGVLHLLGHDHETDDGEMRRLEAELARQLFGSTRGLIERSGAATEPRGGGS